MPIPDMPADPALRLAFLASLVVCACVAAVLGAVLWNFLTARRDAERRERRSPVETGSMLLFTAGFYLLIRRDIGELPFPAYPLHLAAVALGLLLLTAGTAVNLLGRLALGRNWANQVTIYAEQTLVTAGVYGLVRHPLYASLIWMFVGAAVVYLNWAALLAALLVFTPMMIYRARQEEAALAERFPEYAEYQRRVGRLLPKRRS
ncbi:MAG TPA: isoprenylcysteine carboxylmethyltransferase family protein [Armatimonadota bacterium]|nr:isoprenylcysteine carboxylmethyltransferase family protein [Armatimonadota bacterium]